MSFKQRQNSVGAAVRARECILRHEDCRHQGICQSKPLKDGKGFRIPTENRKATKDHTTDSSLRVESRSVELPGGLRWKLAFQSQQYNMAWAWADGLVPERGSLRPP